MKRYRSPSAIDRHRMENRERAYRQSLFLADHKKNKPCADCHQIYDPCVMDFDHRDPSKKRKAVGQMATASRKTLLAEIEKCDLVCSNCHRMRTKKSRDQDTGMFFIGFKKADEKQLKFL